MFQSLFYYKKLIHTLLMGKKMGRAGRGSQNTNLILIKTEINRLPT